MNHHLRTDNYGPIPFLSGIPPGFADQQLPQAIAAHAKGAWGIVFIQELKTKQYLLRHFLFLLQKNLSFYFKENNEGLQTLISLKGTIDYHVQGLEPISLKEKEFSFFNAGKQETMASIPGGKICSLLNTYYTADACLELLPYFPDFKKDLQKALENLPYFQYAPKLARFTVHDAIQAIWRDKYIPSLQSKHVELRLKNTLFTLLAQTYTEAPLEIPSPQEQAQASAARDLILKDITKQWTLELIASELYYSPGWLKRAFSKVYGMGMHQLLRKTRMEHARDMLLRGESLKAAALSVGMKPRNFPREFKTFFGYTVTELKKGRL